MEIPNLTEFARSVYWNNCDKGFTDKRVDNIPRCLALIHSEVSEALEADRNNRLANLKIADHLNNINITLDNPEYGKYVNVFITTFDEHMKDTLEVELIDVLLRTLDLLGGMNIDVDVFLDIVIKRNKLRPFKHGNKKY